MQVYCPPLTRVCLTAGGAHAGVAAAHCDSHSHLLHSALAPALLSTLCSCNAAGHAVRRARQAHRRGCMQCQAGAFLSSLSYKGQPHPELLRDVAGSFMLPSCTASCVQPSGLNTLLSTASMVRQLVPSDAGLERALTFSPVIFFYALLPPIVFAAGFTLKKRDFFKK